MHCTNKDRYIEIQFFFRGVGVPITLGATESIDFRNTVFGRSSENGQESDNF